MLKGISYSILLLIVVGSVYFKFGAMPEPLPKGSESAQWLAPGPEKISYFDITLVDDTRETTANGDFSGSDKRRLKTRIWHPQQLDIARPLIVYAHGFMSNRWGGSYLAELLASHGYVVVSADFPLTHFGAPGGAAVADVVQQPGDVSFLLDQVISWSQQEGNQFFGAIDERRIGLVGFSLGGLTATLAAFHPAMADPRLSRVVSIAGPSEGFDKAFFSQRQVPFMMIASPDDAMIAYDRNAKSLPERLPGAVLVSIDGASHTGFTALSRHFRWLDNPDWLGCSQLRDALSEQVNQRWWQALGPLGEELAFEPGSLCQQQVLPKVMNPVRQQWLTAVAVLAFFDADFSLSIARQQEARQFLREGLAAENPEISVEVE